MYINETETLPSALRLSVLNLFYNHMNALNHTIGPIRGVSFSASARISKASNLIYAFMLEISLIYGLCCVSYMI